MGERIPVLNAPFCVFSHRINPSFILPIINYPLTITSWKSIHEALLLRYVTIQLSVPSLSTTTQNNSSTPGDTSKNTSSVVSKEGEEESRNRLSRRVQVLIRRIHRSYLPAASIWELIFQKVVSFPTSVFTTKKELLKEVFEQWRVLDPVEASLGYARYWLKDGGGGMEVVAVGQRILGELKGKEKVEVERRWRGMLDEVHNPRPLPDDKDEGGDESGGEERNEEMVLV